MQLQLWSGNSFRIRIVFSFILINVAICALYYFLSKGMANEDQHFSHGAEGKYYSTVPNDELVEYISNHLSVEYHVVSNYGDDAFRHEIKFQNKGTLNIPAGNSIGWSVYFNCLHLPEYDIIVVSGSYLLPSGGFRLTHIDGSLMKLEPTPNFNGIQAGRANTVLLKSYITVSRSYILPRWYVTAPGEQSRIIKRTDDDDLDFVTSFNTTKQVKRSINDYSAPFTAQKRYERYFTADMNAAPLKVIPSPLLLALNEDEMIRLNDGQWVVCSGPTRLKDEIIRFADMFSLHLLPEAEPIPPTHFIQFQLDNIEGVPECEEAYEIFIDAEKPCMKVTAQGEAGAFYAVQTLLSLAETDGGKLQYKLPAGHIKDAARFGYRGLHVDVARNFIQLQHLLTLIETMAMYKLNRLHLHLTDDEGWRMEIGGLPELTQIAAVRRHCEVEDAAIYPALGSGPNTDTSGSGFYSVSDYKKILRVASANHIQVIPEVDLPGHSHAAIRAMEARYHRLIAQGKAVEAEEFLLSDPDDDSSAISVQHYRNNAVNPCMPSTYRFVDHVVSSLKKMHSKIQPLKMFHIGGDEVAKRSWTRSPICKEFMKKATDFPKRTEDLQEHFMRQAAKIVGGKHGLGMSVWEDGALKSPDEEPYEKSALHGTDVTAYAWHNSWTSKSADRPHKLANAGYKVVMSQATHLYFDHPQEPDPEERGLIWATRYIDDKIVFDFRPDDLYGNAKIDKNGAPLSADEVDRIRDSRTSLHKPENIIGMQAALWTELVRDVTMLHSQLFPRLIAFAERAWHKAEWEGEDSREMRSLRNKEWTQFANIVGYKELARLKRRGILYRIPPPGVTVGFNRMEICALYPGFKFLYRPCQEGGKKSDWMECVSGTPIKEQENTCYEFVTADGERTSRVVKLDNRHATS